MFGLDALTAFVGLVLFVALPLSVVAVLVALTIRLLRRDKPKNDDD